MFDCEIQQEDNIKYVAYIRTKKRLNFIDTEQIENNKEQQLSLGDIRIIINQLYLTNFGISPTDINNIINKNKSSLKPTKIRINVNRNDTSKIGFETNKEKIFSKLKSK